MRQGPSTTSNKLITTTSIAMTILLSASRMMVQSSSAAAAAAAARRRLSFHPAASTALFVPSSSSSASSTSMTMTKSNAYTRHYFSSSKKSSSVHSNSRLYHSKSSYMVMWGEEPSSSSSQQQAQPKIPIPSSSKFFSSSSSDSGDSGSRQQLRPARRGGGGAAATDADAGSRKGGSGNGGSWYDDDDEQRQQQQQQQQQQRQERGRGRKVSSSSNGWYDDEDFGSNNDFSRRGGGAASRGTRGEFRGRGDDRGGRGGRGRSDYSRDGGGRERFGGRGGGGGGRYATNRGGRDDSYSIKEKGRGRQGDAMSPTASSSSSVGKINLKAIENAGYEHLYGIAPVLNALKANVRTLSTSDNDSDDEAENRKRLLELVDGFDDNDDVDDRPQITTTKTVKPEAKLSPHLFVQEGMLDTHNLSNLRISRNNNRRSGRSNAKKEASSEIITLAQSYNADGEDDNQLPIVEVDKGVLNTLSGNRPHQGFVLRCGTLDFEPVRKLPLPLKGGGNPSLWLALDEVVDPQNLGALLRSAYFLGRGAGIITDDDNYLNSIDDNGRSRGKVGILVCSKNSSPLSPTVSAASAGALEFMTIYSTSNLPKLLNNAKDDGWRILGAAAADADSFGRDGNSQFDDDEEDDANANSWNLGDNDNNNYSTEDAPTNQQKKMQQQYHELDEVETGHPTILVLGSEGRGLRTLVARACTGFVSIPGGNVAFASLDDEDNERDTSSQAGVDSLNVSVTGGILLWHFLTK